MKTCDICGGTIMANGEHFAGDFQPCICGSEERRIQLMVAQINDLAKRLEELENLDNLTRLTELEKKCHCKCVDVNHKDIGGLEDRLDELEKKIEFILKNGGCCQRDSYPLKDLYTNK